ncbi:MAG: hypothetical protein ACK52I_20150, partial [Pseudomonadota bacterium]
MGSGSAARARAPARRAAAAGACVQTLAANSLRSFSLGPQLRLVPAAAPATHGRDPPLPAPPRRTAVLT